MHRLLLFCLLASMGVVSFLVIKAGYQVHLRFEVASSAPARAQLFLNTGHGFNEDESVRFDLHATSSSASQTIEVPLPARPILELRFDPSDTAGTFLLRNFILSDAAGHSQPLQVTKLTPFHEIARLQQEGSTVRIETTPAATDPGIRLELAPPLQPRFLIRREKAWRLLGWNGPLLALFLLLRRFSNKMPAVLTAASRARRRWNAPFQALATHLSDPNFITFDSLSLEVYLFCLVSFVLTVSANLNGSSSEFMHDMYQRAGTATMLLGQPRGIRSDEWGYSTPDVLSQAFRTDRFQALDSDLGGHSVALLGNLPVKHPTALARPQFWGFFLLPAEYGYAFFWQSKAFLLFTGIFTWLLWLTGSSRWSLAGALWFLFSPSTQWSYSWPSALPEMVGLSCLATTAFAYLLVGRHRAALAASALVAAITSVDFALCAYLPQMIPLAWVQIAVLAAWCWGMRVRILATDFRSDRVIALAASLCLVAGFGALIFRDVHVATAAIANTTYPGHRMLAGGSIPIWELLAQLLPWYQSEGRFPALLGNVSEGSGFLWLAPFTLLCLPKTDWGRPRRALFAGLWIVFAAIAAWLVLPLPESAGALFGLNRTFGGRCIPALGLANIAIVSLCLAHHRFSESQGTRARTWTLRILLTACATALFYFLFQATSDHLAGFFSRKELVTGSVLVALALTLMVLSRHRVLALALVGSQALYFGGINPVQQGVHVYSQSALFRFMHSDPAFTRDRWMIYTDQPVLSGLFSGVGCEIYTGTRYLPDIDHFPLFAARGLDVNTLNRLGYLVITLPKSESESKVQMMNPIVVDWQVSPTDPLLPQIGIHYAAFDATSQTPPPEIASRMIRLSDHPVDGFWLYRLP